ncbi:hypothetical protein [Sphingomonas sp.]|uniref:hypothetical protein n=1 Tax=Sphingomonas sp. TaxID=28214 RepID=UPI00257CF13B|nr:hypothetical protein [Sphingomonas sp.]
MAVYRQSIPIVRNEIGASAEDLTLNLLAGLKHFAATRASRQLIRDYEAAGVKSEMSVPLLREECAVDPRKLRRALRLALRTALGEASAGDLIRIEILPDRSFEALNIVAGPLAEVRPDLVR